MRDGWLKMAKKRWRKKKKQSNERVKKWLDIGERVSCEGHLSCTAGMERGKWMEVQRVAT